MHRHRATVLFVSTLAVSSLLLPAFAHAAAPSFTISATDVTMPATGMGNSSLTAVSQNGYSGALVVSCSPENAPMGAKLPTCAMTSPGIALASGKTAQARIYLVPYGQAPPPTPAASRNGAAITMTFAGALLLGFGLRRRARNFGWLVLAAAMLASTAGIVACGGGGTHGTFVYNVVATDSSTQATATTTMTVTLP